MLPPYQFFHFIFEYLSGSTSELTNGRAIRELFIYNARSQFINISIRKSRGDISPSKVYNNMAKRLWSIIRCFLCACDLRAFWWYAMRVKTSLRPQFSPSGWCCADINATAKPVGLLLAFAKANFNISAKFLESYLSIYSIVKLCGGIIMKMIGVGYFSAVWRARV